jgi:putative membrane protein
MHWFKVTLRIKGSVIPAIIDRVLFCSFFGFLISFLHYFKLPVSWTILNSVVPSVVLGLLLVFRTNTAYERFWEGRKCWGTLVNNVRNLARNIWIAIAENEPEDRVKKK